MQLQLKPSSLRPDRRAAGNAAGPAVRSRAGRGTDGLTLVEVLLAIFIAVLVFSSIINGYLTSAIREQWTGYSLAAQSLGLQTIEQARSAVWDPNKSVGANQTENELTNLTLLNSSLTAGSLANTYTFSGYMTNILDVPWNGTNYVLATNYVTITMLYENNNTTVPIQLQEVKVQTVWPFSGWGGFKLTYYTNTICTYVAPDNRDPSTLGAGGWFN